MPFSFQNNIKLTTPTPSLSQDGIKFLAKEVEEFRALYSKHFGVLISKDEAIKELSLLVRQCELIYQPVTFAELERLTHPYNRERL